MTDGNIDSTNIDQPVVISQLTEVDYLEASLYIPMPSFVNDREGEELCSSILSYANIEK